MGWLVNERGRNILNVTIGYPEIVTVTRESGPAAGSRAGRSGEDGPWGARAKRWLCRERSGWLR
jgi:hypothetical protein